MKHLLILTLLLTLSQAQKFKYREFKNIENFYSSITKDVIQLSIKHHTPPAVILAIAGLESGYGSGYISQITGNILSLGAGKHDIQLPALDLPYCKTDKYKKILFDPKEQQQCKKLVWIQRPKSLKKDYRPKNIAGTDTNLEFFKYNPNQFKKAELHSINDFLTKWLSQNNKYTPFRETKQWLDQKVAKEGIDTLLTAKTNREFISKIGGRKNSFNYRKSWSKKVKYILKNIGLIELCSTLYYQKVSFKKAWEETK